MGISINEFKTAMETYGATRLSDVKINNTLVPRFFVGDVVLQHSGSDYVFQNGREIPTEIMSKAMVELGEKYPGGDNFWCGEIHSVKGLLTLVSMFENRYSKKLVESLTRKTYQKLCIPNMDGSNSRLAMAI